MKVLRLYSDCIPIKGYNRSIIYDLTREDFEFIPNSLHELLIKYEGKSRYEIQNNFQNQEELTILEEYFSFLEEKEFIMWIDEHQSLFFPKLNLEWSSPSKITNAIIDIDDKSNHNFNDIFNQLEELNCQAILLRSFYKKNFDYWVSILEHCDKKSIRTIQILTPFLTDEQCLEFKKLFFRYPRLHALTFSNSPFEKMICEEEIENRRIIFIQDIIKDVEDCQIVNIGYFTINIQLFSESQNYNTYLNRKVTIDSCGEIKNCSSCKIGFGSVKEDTILNCINNEEFNKLWSVKKDIVDVCKVCEFRHMCTTSIVPKERKDGSWFLEKECPYNPYISKWRGEEGYLTLSDFGVNVEEKGFSISGFLPCLHK